MTLSISNIAFQLSDGAGNAAKRIHKCLLAYGLDSNVAVATLSQQPTAGELCIPRLTPSSLQRLRIRLKVFPAKAEQWSRQLMPFENDPCSRYELFSLPFSNYAPEKASLVGSADVIHLHWVSGLIDFSRFFQNLSKPIVWSLHDQQPYLGGFHYEIDRSANPMMAGLESACFKLKQDALKGHHLAVVGNSDWNTSLASESGMFPSGTTFQTIYYPLDTQAYCRRDQKSARLGLGLPTDTFIVGFAATSLENRRKGLSVLLDALRLLPTDEYPVMLLSFGRPPSAEVIANMPHPWVHLGVLDDDRIKALVYSAMSCFVVPSEAEAFGQTAIEALACETPVIASRTGGLVEAVGDAGLLFEPGDVKALSRTIAQLVRSPDQCDSLGGYGRSLVKERHDPTICARAYMKVYQELISVRSVLTDIP